jgi:hypothetical protein
MSTFDQAQLLRPATGWMIRGLVQRRLETTQTHLPLDEEYWLAVRHPAEVEAVGLELLEANYPGFTSLSAAERLALWREFRSYVRQAEGFFRGAAVLPWKSSPLNHYYAFMNLAKALALCRGLLGLQQPLGSARKLRHGVSARVVDGNPDQWNLTVHSSDGVFEHLYRAVTGGQIPPSSVLNVRQLMSYVSSIAWQFGKTYPQLGRRWFLCYWIVRVHPDHGCWDIVGIPREADLSSVPAAFCAAFEEVPHELAKGFAHEALGLQAVQALAYRFFQRKATIPCPTPGKYDVSSLDSEFRLLLDKCVYENLDTSKLEFGLGLPYPIPSGSTAAMNEFIATYGTMYFLSSLVRYHPDYMDRIGESSDAWLIESFAKSAPLALIRYFVAAILGYTLLIERI